MDGKGLLKTCTFLMEEKMAAGAFGRARNMGETALLYNTLVPF